MVPVDTWERAILCMMCSLLSCNQITSKALIALLPTCAGAVGKYPNMTQAASDLRSTSGQWPQVLPGGRGEWVGCEWGMSAV